MLFHRYSILLHTHIVISIQYVFKSEEFRSDDNVELVQHRWHDDCFGSGILYHSWGPAPVQLSRNPNAQANQCSQW